jgi:tetratricopeptide (TPR) repeat protein
MIGWHQAQLGHYEQALVRCRQALALQPDDSLQASAWDSLGYAHHHLGEYPQATTCYQTALAIYRTLGDRYNEADTLTHLGQAHQAAGELASAAHVWRQAIAIVDELGHAEADQVRAKLRHLDGIDLEPSRPRQPG